MEITNIQIEHLLFEEDEVVKNVVTKHFVGIRRTGRYSGENS